MITSGVRGHLYAWWGQRYPNTHSVLILVQETVSSPGTERTMETQEVRRLFLVKELRGILVTWESIWHRERESQ